MADTVIENLITKLGFDFDEKAIEKFNDGVETAAKGLIAVVGAATAAAAGIFAFTKSVADSNDELGKFSLRTGVDIAALQELGYVAELNGGSIDSMNSSLENLSKIASEAARGVGAGVETFGMLGLSVTDAMGSIKGADTLLLEISDSVSKLGTQAEKLEFTQKLGIGSDLLLSIQNGSEALIRQREEAKALGFAIDNDAAGAAANFNDELLRVKKIVSGVASTIATKLMKQITPMVELFTAWFKVNKDIIQQRLGDFLSNLTDVISGVFNILVRIYNVVNTVIQGFGGWENAIMLVVGAFAVLNASAVLLPLLLAGLGAALFLIIEDLMKFKEGGDSAVGSMLEKFPLLKESLMILLDWIGMIGEGWNLIFTQGDKAFEGFVMMIQDALKWLDKISTKISGVFSLDTLKKLSPLTMMSNFMGNAVPTAGVGSSSNVSNTTNSSSSSPTVNIAINGGNSAEVRKTVTDVLNEQYAGAQTNLKSEVEF